MRRKIGTATQRLRELQAELRRWKLCCSQLARRAREDPLTRLPNRFAAQESLSRALSLAYREKRPIGLLMLDLDNFKEINDTRGHAVGDRVLCEVARLLQKNVRRSDFVARWGGDEFIFVLPFANEEAVLAVAERLRSLIAHRKFRAWRGTLTASIGSVSVSPTRQHRPSALIRRADAALYRAKARGGNCVSA